MMVDHFVSTREDHNSVHPLHRRFTWIWRLWPLPLALIVAVFARSFMNPDPEQVFVQAQMEARAGRYDQAAVLVDKLTQLRVATPADHLLKAQVAGGLNKLDIAINALEAIAEESPLKELSRLSQGQLEARRGRLRAAEEAFLKTIAGWPNNLQARKELVYIYSIQRRLKLVDEQLGALAAIGALDKAHLIHWGRVRHVPWSAEADLPALKRYVAADPQDRHSRLSLADAFIRLNRFDEAESVLKPFASSDIDALVVRVRLAEGRFDTEAVDALLAQGPVDHVELTRIRGRWALFRRDTALAVENFEISRRHDPHDRATLNGLATALTLLGRDDEAEPLRAEVGLFDQLGALISRVDSNANQDEALLARRIGLVFAELGRKAEALAWLKQAISREPLDTEAHQAIYRLEQHNANAKASVDLMQSAPH